MIVPQYIPDIWQAVVARVNARTTVLAVDPFPVVFDHGHYAEVLKTLSFKDTAITAAAKIKYPLVWLVMDFDEQHGKSPLWYAQCNFQVLICEPTDPNYTMDERRDNVFKKRLLPIYAILFDELHNTQEFGFPSNDVLTQHTMTMRPYWGLGQGTNGETGTANLFNDYIDAIQIKNLNLSIVNKLC